MSMNRPFRWLVSTLGTAVAASVMIGAFTIVGGLGVGPTSANTVEASPATSTASTCGRTVGFSGSSTATSTVTGSTAVFGTTTIDTTAALCARTQGSAPALADASGVVVTAYLPTQLQNAVTGLCLTGGFDGYVHTELCNGSPFQGWQPRSSGVLSTFSNAQTGQCLQNDGYGHGYGNLDTTQCNGSSSQAWGAGPVRINNQATFNLVNAQTRLCLESDVSVASDTYGPVSGNAYAQACTPGNWQYWLVGGLTDTPGY